MVVLLLSFSAAAGALHIAFAPSHFSESWTHGLFFAVVGMFQLAWALTMGMRPAKGVLAASLLNIAVIAVWAVSRTAGLPFSDAPEAVGFADAAATTLEILLVAGSLILLRRGEFTARERVGRLGLSIAALMPIVAVLGMSPATGADDHLHVEAANAHETPALSGDTPCEVSGPPASPAQVTDDKGHAHRGPTQQQAIDGPTRQALAAQQLAARSVVDRYPTVAAAEQGGYKMSTPFVPCIGAHYTNIRLVATFDPAAPSELLFDGTTPESKIVGLSYLVYSPGGPPEGFAGPNDIWHQHNANGGLCFSQAGTVIGSEETSPAECAKLGGRKQELKDIWMLHDWVVPGWECSWGVFAPECPELGGRVGGSAWDAPDPSRSLENASTSDDT